MSKQRLQRAGLLCGWIVTSPLLALSVLAALNTVNPMVLAFQYRFEVLNHAGEDIWVTPLGAVGPLGHRYVLPQYFSQLPAIPAWRQGEFKVAPDQSLTIIYDWDDISFSELLIRDRHGKFREFVIDRQPTKDQYRPPAANKFVIPPLNQLPESPAQLVAAIHGHAFNFRAWVFSLSGVLPVILFVFWLRVRREGPNPTLNLDAQKARAG
jgi:hypothetical protein